MDFLSQDIQDKLIKENQEFRKLIEEHHAADKRLLDLSKKLQLSAKEKVEEVNMNFWTEMLEILQRGQQVKEKTRPSHENYN